MTKLTLQLGPNYDPIFYDTAFIGALILFAIIITIITLIVVFAVRSRKYKKKSEYLSSILNEKDAQIDDLKHAPDILRERLETQHQTHSEENERLKIEHMQTIEKINHEHLETINKVNTDHSNSYNEMQESYELQLLELKKKHEEDSKRSFKLGGNQVIGDISQIAGIFGTISEYEHFSLITSVSKQASYDAIGMTEEKLDFIEFKTKGAKLSGKEGLVKKLINDGKVGHRVIDVILPADLQMKDRK